MSGNASPAAHHHQQCYDLGAMNMTIQQSQSVGNSNANYNSNSPVSYVSGSASPVIGHQPALANANDFGSFANYYNNQQQQHYYGTVIQQQHSPDDASSEHQQQPLMSS